MDRDTNLTAKAPESKLRMLGGATDAGGDNYVVFFKDGSALSYDHNTLSTGNNAILQDDGIPYGIPILIDTNGLKGPNALSNCNGESLMATRDTNSDYNNKGKRVIKDQFSVRLRGIYATPNGYAARWAFDN